MSSLWVSGKNSSCSVQSQTLSSFLENGVPLVVNQTLSSFLENGVPLVERIRCAFSAALLWTACGLQKGRDLQVTAAEEGTGSKVSTQQEDLVQEPPTSLSK